MEKTYSPAGEAMQFEKGERVIHKLYGAGTVADSTDRNTASFYVRVQFDDPTGRILRDYGDSTLDVGKPLLKRLLSTPLVAECTDCSQKIHVPERIEKYPETSDHRCARCGGQWDRVQDRWMKITRFDTEKAAFNWVDRHQKEYTTELKVGRHSKDGFVVYHDNPNLESPTAEPLRVIR